MSKHRCRQHPDDWVRAELTYGLSTRDVTVIPVRVDDADWPPAAELPAPLQALAVLNAATVDHDRWDNDWEPLLDRIAGLVGRQRSDKAAPTPEARATFQGSIITNPDIGGDLNITNCFTGRANEAEPAAPFVETTVPPVPAGLIRRDENLDEVIGALENGGTAGVLSMHGAGGVGKTVLAQQAGRDERVRARFPGGVFWVPVGQPADGADDTFAEQVAQRLYLQASGERQPAASSSVVPQVPELLGGRPGRVLVIFDDVWPPTDLIAQLAGAVGVTTSVLYTTRGVLLPDAARVELDRLTGNEARTILLGTSDLADPVAEAADQLSGLLGNWALLLAMAARKLQRWRTANPETLTRRLNLLAAHFKDSPTRFEDIDSHDRSLAIMIDQSLTALPEGTRQRFGELAAYPADTDFDDELLSDQWETTSFDAENQASELSGVGLLVTVETLHGPRYQLHDLIVAYLHHTHGQPG